MGTGDLGDNRDPDAVYTDRTLQLVNDGFQLYFGVEKATCFKLQHVSFKEPWTSGHPASNGFVEFQGAPGIQTEETQGRNPLPGAPSSHYFQPLYPLVAHNVVKVAGKSRQLGI